MNKGMEKKELKKNRRGRGKDEERDKGIRRGKKIKDGVIRRGE